MLGPKTNNNQANYTRTTFDYSSGPIINHLRAAKEYVHIITIKRAVECNVTTHGGKVTIASPPPPR